jgi:hypothetical protein
MIHALRAHRVFLASPPVECFFSVTTRPAIRRGSLISVKELVAAIGTLIDHWNDHASPFAWTEDSDATLAAVQRVNTKANVLTGH